MTDGVGDGVPEGWYPDPWASQRYRWWNGRAWTEHEQGGGWPLGIVRSPSAREIGRVILVCCGLGAVVAAAVVAVLLARHHPVHGLAFLLFPAVPVLAAGQLWAIAQQFSRRSPERRGFRGVFLNRSGDPLRGLFGSLDRRIGAVLVAGFAVGWLTMATAFSELRDGGPEPARLGCAYPLLSHGAVTCVDAQRYEAVQVAEQRLGAGLFLGFFCFQAGAAAGGLREATAAARMRRA